MNEERLNVNLTALTDAVRELIAEVRVISEMLRPVAEAIAEKGMEGEVARAVMGRARWTVSPEDYAAIQTALEAMKDPRSSWKIKAIKAVRKATGLGLREAKDLVDAEGADLLGLFEVR